MDADIGHGGGQCHFGMVAQRVWGGCQKYPKNSGQIVMWLLMLEIPLVVEHKIYEERQP